jgi:hypothetical protein
LPGNILVFIIFGVILFNIASLLWVYRDASNRGMDNAVMWLVVVLLLGPVGVLIYLPLRTRTP